MEALRITRVEGTGLPIRGEDIDTDRIIPARFLRAITFDGLEQYAFIDDRAAATKSGAQHPLDDPRYASAAVLLVNRNFGCGSSREHAPQALHRWGIRTIIGESFSEIFFGNAMMIGLPCVTAKPPDVDALMSQVESDPDLQIVVDLQALSCTAGNRTVAIAMPPNVRDAFITGAWDTTGLLRERYEEVNATAARLPYVSGFR
jgi:3-isopropylmalate/(R)-2-methylmalate dehydratase small subunit